MRKAPPPQSSASNKGADSGKAGKPSTLSEIQRLQKNRDERRKAMEQAKTERAAEEQRNRESGNPGDVDFQRMIRGYREAGSTPVEQPHAVSGDMKICICVRKRPISSKEVKKMDHDSVTCLHPIVVVHDCKMKVDGISKYLDNQAFEMDHTFHEDNTTEEIYAYAVEPLINFVLGGGRGTVFAYGQTGSGKTYTMMGVQGFLAEDLFREIEARSADKVLQVYVSFFEIYGGRCQDLLNSRQRLNVREDGSGEVIVGDLLEIEADSVAALQTIIDSGNRNRTTHATESNDVSSRSHAICQICIRNSAHKEVGRLSLIDLAGSERGADTKSHNRQRRMEGAEINKSLLALKECIRALDGNSTHVPYRASKLTLVLKDSFTRQKSRTVMITCVSPAASSADHTINTLRYADRIKERVVSNHVAAPGAAAAAAMKSPPPAVPPARLAAAAAAAVLPPSLPPSGAAAAAAAAAQPRRNISEHKSSAAADAKPVRSVAASAGAGAKSDRGYKGGAFNAYDDNDDFGDEDEDEDERLFEQHEPAGHRRASRGSAGGRGGYEGGEDEEAVNELHRTVQDLFDEEETLLNLHMNVIQENAELLTEEGQLLQQMQGEDNDIDAYSARLDEILVRKQDLIAILREKLAHFRKQLVLEETMSMRVRGNVPSY